MITKHEIVQTEAQPCAAIRITVPRSEIQHVMGPGYQELMDTLGAQGVAPAGPWFNKVQCFCFTEQLLLPGQSVDLPVIFFVDSEMDKDRRYENVRTITLSYTFFEAKTERAKTLLGGVSAGATGKGG